MHHKIPKVALLDNHDSFIHNIVHEVAVCNCEWRLFLHDQTSVNDIFDHEPTHIILGPVRRSQDAHVMIGLIKETAHRIPILESVLDTKHWSVLWSQVGTCPNSLSWKPDTITHTGTDILQIYPLQHNLVAITPYTFTSRNLVTLATSSDDTMKHSNIRGYLYLSVVPTRVFYRVN